MDLTIEPMTGSDYDEAYALWQETEGMGLSSADSPSAIAAYLLRNPGLSLVARINGVWIGTVLCGHEGRRGFLHHLAVARGRRGQGIGKGLVDRCLSALAAAGIQKCHIFLHVDNRAGEAFWRHTGWKERTELKMMSHDVER